MAIPDQQHPEGFPACISLSITFNDHAVCYQTIEDYLEHLPCGEPDWVSPEERQKAIDGNSLWECHWYPKTPIGSHTVAASSLSALLAFMNGL
jgi:hypothetical protein